MRTDLKHLTLDAMFAALIAVCAQITIPTAIPFTMQTFAIALAIVVLKAKHAFVAIGVYFAIGFAGVPVFSMFRGGVSVLFSPNAGYILGFFAMLLPFAIVPQKLLQSGIAVIFFLFVSQLLCYACGTLWYIVFMQKSNVISGIAEALSICVVPFVAGDILKIIAAVCVGERLKKYRING